MKATILKGTTMRRVALCILVTARGSGGSDPEPPPPPVARVVSGDQQHAIAFERSGQLCTISVDGSDLNCMTGTDPIAGGERIDWSPDGTRIAFSVPLPGDACAAVGYVVQPDGSGLEEVASGHPSWSPDGSKLVYGPASCTHGQISSLIATSDAVAPYERSYVVLISDALSSPTRFPSWGP